MVLVPAQDGDGESDFFATSETHQPEDATQTEYKIPKKENSIRKYAADRQRKLLNVVLRVAAYGGYDEMGRIKTKDGSFMESSDIVPLLLYALSPGRQVHGLDEFVDLLYRADVDPEDIINTNVRELLRKRHRQVIRRVPFRPIPRIERRSVSPVPMNTDEESNHMSQYSLDDTAETIAREKKRMRDEVEEHERSSKKTRWDSRDSDDD